MKIVESPDSLFHSDPPSPPRTRRESRQLHLSTSRNSSLKANVMKAVQIIQEGEKGKLFFLITRMTDKKKKKKRKHLFRYIHWYV